MNETEYEELRRQYRETDYKCAEFFYRLSSRKMYELTVFVPEISKRNECEKELKDLRDIVDALPVPEPLFDVLKGHFSDFLDSLSYKIASLFENPLESLTPFLWGYEDLMDAGTVQEQKAEKMKVIYRQLPDIWNAVRSFYGNSDPVNIRTAAAYLADASEGVLKKSYGDEELQTLMELTSKRFASYADELKGLLSGKEEGEGEGQEQKELSDDVRTIQMPVEEYRALLRDHCGVDLDELLSWGTDEAEKTRDRCFELAGELADLVNEKRPETMKEVNDLLFKYEGPCDSADEMFERASVYLKRTRALAHEYVRLPDDEKCELVETPWKLRESYPWGGYSNGNPDARPLVGQMFLNQYNYTAVTDGWIRMNCLHEAYPGHHVQFVRTALDPIPETMKIGAKNIPLMEGMCHRTEQAFEFIYGDDPFFPLFVAYRQHHTAVRIEVDLMLRYEGRPISDAVHLYEEELGFDERTARGQVQAHENMPGYFTCYYYGMKKICDWEKKYGFEKKEYTELLFSLCQVSLETFEKMLKLDKEERGHFFNDFASLMM